MKQMKKKLFMWLLALLSTVMVLVSLAGCSSGDVNKALDTAIDVIEAVEAIEAAASEAEMEAALASQAESLMQTEYVEEPSISEIESEAFAETESETLIETEEEQTEAEADLLTVEEDGHYTSKEEVALYLHTYGKLPSNFISKKEAEELGWKKKDGEAGQLHVVAPGMSIGGSSFGNYEGLLPEKKGRKYYECDINYKKGNRGAERIVYSNDGLIFYTGDHYESFEQLYPAE